MDFGRDVLFCYAYDGGLLNMPIVKQKRKYSKPHWLPATLSLFEAGTAK
jgi:hypothetical protein